MSDDADPIRDREQTRRRLRFRRRASLAGALIVVAVSVLITFRRPLFDRNFGVVEEGRVFRSAQPGGWLTNEIVTRHLGAVLNLRGGSPDDPFYKEEVQVTRDRGVSFYDFPMNAERRPTRSELLTLLDFFEGCPYPLLIHCRQGADRTGLASALYLMSQKGVKPEEAEAALSLSYGHFNLGPTAHLHEPLVEYAEWLRRSRLSHTPVRFRGWVQEQYRSEGGLATFRPLRPGPRKSLAGRSRTADGSTIIE